MEKEAPKSVVAGQADFLLHSAKHLVSKANKGETFDTGEIITLAERLKYIAEELQSAARRME